MYKIEVRIQEVSVLQERISRKELLEVRKLVILDNKRKENSNYCYAITRALLASQITKDFMPAAADSSRNI